MEAENSNKHREEVCPSKKDQLVQIELAADRDPARPSGPPQLWRSLQEFEGDPEFEKVSHREFPKGASEWLPEVSRRSFIQLLGSSLALAGMTACTKQPLEPIVPYVRQPEELVPGRPMYYATAFEMGGYATPVLVESHMYRPTKIEGNEQHPVSEGGTDLFAQASILDLYDPDRSQTITYLGDVRTWGEFVQALHGPLAVEKGLQGVGIRILTQTVSSPTLADQLHSFLQAFPQAKWHVYEPVNRDNVFAGAQMSFGQPLEPRYQLDAADIIVSLDSDFLYGGFPGCTRYARDFSARRNPENGTMNRMYAIESTPTSTGAKSDHRLPARSLEIEGFARALASAVGVNAGGQPLSGDAAKFLNAVVGDLKRHSGASVIIPGDHQPPVVHALCHAMNQALGNVGKTVVYADPISANTANQVESLKELVTDMRGGKVDVLIILGGNPAYDAPADFGFADALKNTNIPLRIHLGLYDNETAELCQWHLNEAHYLESWGDTRAYDGTVTIVQPLIAPLYNGRTAAELLAMLGGKAEPTAYELVQAYWKKQHPGADFDLFWRRSLHNGWVEGTALAPKLVKLNAVNFPAPSAVSNQAEINFCRDSSVYDGRFANNGFLQECPRPMTKIVWDNPVMVSPGTAKQMGLEFNDVLKLELNGQAVTGPVWIQPGHPDNSFSVFLGYGRTRAGRAGTGAGFDVYPLRFSSALYSASGASVTKTGATYILASTQGQQTMTAGGDTRPLVRTTTVDGYKKDPVFADADKPEPNQTLYPPYEYGKEPYAWGMTIDLNSCVGCNNCIVACQTENNIPVVGKYQCNHGRHMHWLRVDVYYQGDPASPKAFFEPVPCMQCEDAPCEVVCPVGATVHSSEGLNDMVYNRCVGTRYCSNNCPYKVRRFNFLLFQDWTTEQFKMMRNPDVTVRSRGVMEKCTYCVQRINEHRIDAERENRRIRDMEVKTACQQSCPANAIVFGNINDPNSRVSRLKAEARNYGLLQELNTRPRTTYLAAITNPNPELGGEPEIG
jgi:MoCo/4Fe-4S cofactor protein with predicted Tat translocation signal